MMAHRPVVCQRAQVDMAQIPDWGDRGANRNEEKFSGSSNGRELDLYKDLSDLAHRSGE